MKKGLSFLLLLVILSAVKAQSTNGTIKGRLYYDLANRRTKTGADLPIYLIPNTTVNAAVIRDASAYSPACNEIMLRRSRGYKVAISDKSGVYYFTNITAGRYLVKICTYYGGYYSFTIRSNFTGTINLPDYEVDPPIRN
jgi:hypothetical protein